MVVNERHENQTRESSFRSDASTIRFSASQSSVSLTVDDLQHILAANSASFIADSKDSMIAMHPS